MGASTVKVVLLGDIVGKPGRRIIADKLPALKTDLEAEFCIANCENAAGGSGVTPEIVEELLRAGADVLAVGNLAEGLEEYLGITDPTPGNLESGISTLAEKSLGTVLKIGHDPSVKIADVLPFAGRVPRNGGLYFMDSPGEDLLSISGMTAGGAHAIVFTTGLGTPIGSAVAPVLKVTANRDTYERMRGIIDVYLPVERMFEDGVRLRDLAMEVLWPRLLEVLSGEPTRSERLGQVDFNVRGYWLRT